MESLVSPGLNIINNNEETSTETRLEMLQQELAVKQAELDSLRALPRENKFLREKLLALKDRVDMMATDWVEPVTGESISLRAHLLAYQRHSRMLKEELDRKEETVVEMQGKLEQQEENLLIYQNRCRILYERLQSVGGMTVNNNNNNNEETSSSDKPTSIIMNEDDPSSFLSLSRKLRTVEVERDLLRERLMSLQEDYERRGVVMAAIRRENATLRSSVSQLIQQVQSSTVLLLDNVVENGTKSLERENEEKQCENADETHRRLLMYHAKKDSKRDSDNHGDSQGG